MTSIFDGKLAIDVWFSVWLLSNDNNKFSIFSAWLIPGFDFTLRNGVIKNLPLIYPLATYVGFRRKKILLQKIFQNHRTTYFPWLLKINFLHKTSFLGKFKWFFFQYFQCKFHNCGYEGTKALTECYWSHNLQKWSESIAHQNAKKSYII